jgi:predicted transport protein
MDLSKAEISFKENIFKNTGKTLEQWISIVKKEKFEKHGEIIKFLKEDHSFTHGFANFVALKARGADAGSADNKDTLIEKQYKGKEQFLPVYNKLIKEILKLGKDIEIAPKNNYVSLRRKKQFATLQPATKTRFEIGLNLKGTKPGGVVETVTSSSAMCSHKINIADEKDITKEVIKWIGVSYQNAG